MAAAGKECLKQLLIYEQPLVLNRLQHRNLCLKPLSGRFEFASALNSVPLTTTEFVVCARDYPIVFAGEAEIDQGAGMPIALLGLTRSHNLFVEADGQWAAQHYVPAFLRRYPFAVAGAADESSDFSVCIDERFVSSGPDGQKLFEESGEDAPALVHAIKFLSDYQQEVRRTQAFMRQLREHLLLIPKTVHVELPDEPPQVLGGFQVIDENRLQKLDGNSLEKLSLTGALGLIYAHLASLGNVQRLSARLDATRKQSMH